MGHDAHDGFSSHSKTYFKIGALLGIFTIITVGLSFVDFTEYGFGDTSNMLVGMAVATFKAALVALIFMHLNGERPMIYKILVFTLAFTIVLFSLFIFAHDDHLTDEGFEAVRKAKVTKHAAPAHH
jgi:caa(3)-type oxidase subunit IV